MLCNRTLQYSETFILNINAFDCPNCCGEWEGWDPVNWFKHTGWVAIVTQTDRPKLCNQSFWWRFCVVTLLFGFSVGVGAFVIGLSQISSCFPCILQLERTLCLRLTCCNEILSNFLWSEKSWCRANHVVFIIYLCRKKSIATIKHKKRWTQNPSACWNLTVAAKLFGVSFDQNFRNRCSFALAFGMMIGVGVKDFGYGAIIDVMLHDFGRAGCCCWYRPFLSFVISNTYSYWSTDHRLDQWERRIHFKGDQYCHDLINTLHNRVCQ